MINLSETFNGAREAFTIPARPMAIPVLAVVVDKSAGLIEAGDGEEVEVRHGERPACPRGGGGRYLV